MIGPVPESWAVEVEAARARAVGPGIWRLRLPSAYWHIDHSNAYALEGPDGLTLIDCGPGGHPSTHEALERALGEAGFGVEQVTQLVITHYHCDHVGAAAWVAERSGCRVWMHPAHDHFTAGMRRPEEVYAKRRHRAVQEGVPERWLDIYASVKEELNALDGDVRSDHDAIEGTELWTGAGRWTVVETPGHAPSHIGLHHTEQRVLISADLIFSGFAPYYDYGCTPDPVGEFLGSLDRVEAMDLEAAMPGHGRPMTRAEIAVAITGHRAGVHGRLEVVRDALRDGATNAWEVLQVLDPERAAIPRGAWIFGEVLGYLRHLRLRGEVVRERSREDRFVHRLR